MRFLRTCLAWALALLAAPFSSPCGAEPLQTRLKAWGQEVHLVHPSIPFCSTNISYIEFPGAAATTPVGETEDELDPPRAIAKDPEKEELYRELAHTGAADNLVELIREEVGSLEINDVGVLRATRSRELKAIVDRVVRMTLRNRPLRSRFGSGELVSLLPGVVHAQGETVKTSGVRLAPADKAVLERVYSKHRGGAVGVLGRQFCSSQLVVCAAINDELRVVGLFWVVLAPTEQDLGDNFDTLSPWNPLALPSALSELPMLRMIRFSPLGTRTNPEAISGADACTFLQSLPSLEVLSIARQLPASCALPGLKALVIMDNLVGGGLKDTATKMKAMPSMQRLGPEAFQFACHSPLLKLFETDKATGLPACMERNTELLRVDLRGGALQGPLPPQFSRWTKLVDFIAFEQGAEWCHPGESRLNQSATDIPFECKASFLAKAGIQDEVAPLWYCPDSGWVVHFDDPSNPWWSWGNLERFWVDVNFLHGSIPADLADKWPRLRTLDLYGNELTGAVPASLCKLTQLKTLQLQDNHLSGEFPFEAFFQRCPGHPDPGGTSNVCTFSLSLNPNLRGCVSTTTLRDAAFLGDFYVNYTQIEVDEDECTPTSRLDLEDPVVRNISIGFPHCPGGMLDHQMTLNTSSPSCRL
eukprot:m.302886 g.302886  ORF g.302886 m.302886 type:complete len:644 (+) comp16314_c3_seq2:635-2566(+)